jgi:ribosomal protein L10
MIHHKKKINKIKTEIFLKEFPIIFLLQHNNFTIKNWFDFRQKLQEINNDCVEFLNVKNSLLKKSLLTLNCEDNLVSLCQGPNLILGCKDETQLKSIWNFLNSYSKLVFITCLYKKKILNHLDVETYFKTTSSVYSQFLVILDKKTQLCSILEQSIKLYPLFAVKLNHIKVLECLKQRLSSS